MTQRVIRRYLDSDLDELLDVWYRASRVGHPFLDEAFPQEERRRIAEVRLPQCETWVHLDAEVFAANEIGRLFYSRCGFEPIGESVHGETGQPIVRLRWRAR